jgi:salicylate hydroxylase
MFSNLWINQVADIYNLVRVPHAITRSKASINQGYLGTLQAPGFEHFQEGDDVPKVMLEELFRVLEKNWNWTTTDPDRERTIALDYLDRQITAML